LFSEELEARCRGGIKVYMKVSNGFPERIFRSAFLAWQLLGQHRVPYWSGQKLEKVQNRKVRNLVRFASRHVPWYRELFSSQNLDPRDFKDVSDLSRLPILTSLQVKKDSHLFRPEGVGGETLRLISSGTTGVHKEIDHGPFSIFTNAAHGERLRHFTAGQKKGPSNYREAMIVIPQGSAGQELQQYVRRKAYIPGWRVPRRKYFSMLDDMSSIVSQLDEFEPDVIRGYGSALTLLFEEVFRTGRSFHRPACLVYSADKMAPALKSKIMEEFKIPVYGIYSSVECLQIGFECERHRGYHLNEDCYPLRVVDHQNRPLADGETGRIIVSNLINRSFVLLNYELGDEGRIVPGDCGCGRKLRMLDLEVSRFADQVELKDGIKVHPVTFLEVLDYEKAIWQHQIVEQEDGSFDILLVTDPSADREKMVRRLEEEFGRWFQGRIRYQIRFVDKINLTRGGKQKTMVFRGNNQ